MITSKHYPDMRRYLTCLILLMALPTAAGAQGKGTIIAGFEAPVSLYGKTGLKTAEWSAEVGYNITDWLYAAARGDISIGMFDNDGAKSHQLTETGAAVLGFNFLRRNYGVYTLKASAGANGCGEEWHYMYYSCGAYFHYGSSRIKPFLGVGVKFYDSRNNNYKDYMRVYISFGFRLN